MKKLFILLFILCITNTYCFSEEEIKSAKSDMNKDCVKVIYEGRNSYGLKNFCTEEILIPPTYNYVESIKNTNIYKVEKKEKGKSSKWGMYDASKREFILPVEYNFIYNTRIKNLFKPEQKTDNGLKLGLFNAEYGEIIIPAEYKNVLFIKTKTPDLIMVVKYLTLTTFKCGLYNISSNELLIPIEHNIITPSHNDLYFVQNGQNFGIYDAIKKEFIIPIAFKDVGLSATINPEIIIVHQKYSPNNTKVGIYDASKREFILPVEYDGIYEKEGITKKYGMYIVRKGTKYGVFSTKEFSMIVPVEINNSEALNYILKMLIILR